jgi:hypothetical protein
MGAEYVWGLARWPESVCGMWTVPKIGANITE